MMPMNESAKAGLARIFVSLKVAANIANDQGGDMDVIVTPAEGGTVWQLTDLLGRSMGRITASAPHQFMIYSVGHAMETMAGILQGPHASLDAALARSKGTPGRLPAQSWRRSALNGHSQFSSSAEYRMRIRVRYEKTYVFVEVTH